MKHGDEYEIRCHNLKMEEGRSSEMLVSYHITIRRHTTWRCGQQGPPKWWYPTTSLHGVTTWRCRQHGHPKRWYPAASLQGVTTRRWRQQDPPKRWYPT